jgi:ribosomal protein S18 acetylase RimI-like enzyme
MFLSCAAPMISTRIATRNDAEAVAGLVNRAFLVEQFFIERDRTDPDTVRGLMQKGQFLLAEDGPALAGCVYFEVRGERGYFGMLSVEPSRQGMGVGHQLVAAVEKYLQDRGCRFCDMKIVNVRTELYDLYRRWGYAETGTSPYDDPHPTKIPVHFVHMSKSLGQQQQ